MTKAALKKVNSLGPLLISVCRYKVHKKCASKAQKSCKWTTIDCIPTDDRLVGMSNDEVKYKNFHVNFVPL